jgi:hypothetical protein
MKRFCSPDPYSRTDAEGGARLVLIDQEHRDWGWRVVNHGRYREKARKASFDAARAEDGRNAQRMASRRATREDPTRPDATRADPPSDSNTNSDVRERPRKRGSRLPDDFQPDLDYAREKLPDIDAEAEAERFKDYWRSAPGQKGIKHDWAATWRVWIGTCRNDGRYARKATPANGQAHVVPQFQ